MPRDEVPRWVRLLLRFIDVVAPLTPAARRSAWKAEWRAEIMAAARRRRAGGRGGAIRIGLWTTSAVVDALWLRGEQMTVERWSDGFRLGARTLTRSPAFTLMAVLTLGLGIGGTTSIFSLANWALLRPIPGVERPAELLTVTPRPAGVPTGIMPLSHPTVRRLTSGGPATAGVAAYTSLEADVVVQAGQAPIRLWGQIVTPGFFPTLGVEPVRGRVFRGEEGDPSSVHAVTVVSHDFWDDHMGGEEGALGRMLEVNGVRLEVVGVAPPGFQGPSRTGRASLWVPSSAIPAVRERVPANILTMEGAPLWPALVVRPASGATAKAVGDQLTRAAPELEQRETRLEVSDRFGMPPGLRARMTETLAIVGGLVALLLGLTVANLVNLVLSRVTRRRREAVVRKAMGASSLSLTGTLAAEGALLALLGAGAAIPIGFGLLKLLDGATLLSWMPTIQGVPLDIRVMVFALGTALVATATASVLGAVALQRLSASDVLRASQGVTGRGRRLRRVMVTLQVAFSLALVVGAGLLVRSLSRLQAADLGFDPDGVVVFSLTPGIQGYSDVEADRLFRELVLELEEEPGIESASFTWMAPFRGGRYMERVRPLGSASEDDVVDVQANMVSPSFFEDLGIEVVEGRAFDDREYGRSDRPERGAVVLNRSLAERIFPDGAAVGREVVMPGRREQAFEVLGVVEDARLDDPKEEPGPALYDPFGNGYRTTRATFVVRGADVPEAMISRIREIVRRRDARLPLLEPTSLEDLVASQLSEERALVRITSAFAILALILAAAGLYGLMTEVVQSRVREFGVRSALGASTGRVVELVLWDSFTMVGAGALLGLLLGFQVSGLLESRLAAGVGPTDPGTYMVATAVLFVVALLASLQPALHSTRIDPVRALRTE